MEKAVVFGCGHTAVEYREVIHKHFAVVAYSCNRPAKWGKKFDGVKIIEPTSIPEDAVIIVASEAHYSEILLGLANQGRSENIYALIKGIFIRCFPTKSAEDNWRFEYPQLEPIPTSLTVDLSGLCNSKCQYCSFHSEYSTEQYFPYALMNECTLEKLIQQIRPIRTLKTLQFIGHGEPMTHPRWQEFVTRLLEAGSFEQCIIFTNGMLLTQENAEKLKNLPVKTLKVEVSVDGLPPEDCEYWRRGEKFSVIRENIHRAYEILKQRAELLMYSCVVLPHSVNTDSPEKVKCFIEESGD